MALDLTNDELEAIIASVKRDLNVAIEEEQRQLAKAEGDEESSPDLGEESSPEASAPPEGSPPQETGGQAPPPPAEDSPAGPDGLSAPQDGQGGGDIAPAPTADALAAEYAQLSPEEFQMHVEAIQLAAQQMGLGGGAPQGAAPGPGPEASAPAPGGPPPGAGGPPPGMEASAPALKNELPTQGGASSIPSGDSKTPSPGNGGKDLPVKKSEDKLDALLAQKEEGLSKAYEDKLLGLVKAMKNIVEAPQPKAVTRISDVAFTGKPGQTAAAPEVKLTKSEVMTKLRDQARNPQLSKKDRALIDGFVDNQVSVDQIKHLLA